MLYPPRIDGCWCCEQLHAPSPNPHHQTTHSDPAPPMHSDFGMPVHCDHEMRVRIREWHARLRASCTCLLAKDRTRCEPGPISAQSWPGGVNAQPSGVDAELGEARAGSVHRLQHQHMKYVRRVLHALRESRPQHPLHSHPARRGKRQRQRQGEAQPPNQPSNQPPSQQPPSHQPPSHQQPPHQQPSHQQPSNQPPSHQPPSHQQPSHQQPGSHEAHSSQEPHEASRHGQRSTTAPRNDEGEHESKRARHGQTPARPHSTAHDSAAAALPAAPRPVSELLLYLSGLRPISAQSRPISTQSRTAFAPSGRWDVDAGASPARGEHDATCEGCMLLRLCGGSDAAIATCDELLAGLAGVALRLEHSHVVHASEAAQPSAQPSARGCGRAAPALAEVVRLPIEGAAPHGVARLCLETPPHVQAADDEMRRAPPDQDAPTEQPAQIRPDARPPPSPTTQGAGEAPACTGAAFVARAVLCLVSELRARGLCVGAMDIELTEHVPHTSSPPCDPNASCHPHSTATSVRLEPERVPAYAGLDVAGLDPHREASDHPLTSSDVKRVHAVVGARVALALRGRFASGAGHPSAEAAQCIDTSVWTAIVRTAAQAIAHE